MKEEKWKKRFLKSIEYIPFHECWEFKLKGDKDGYPQFSRVIRGQKVTLKAHRVSFEFFIGRIPKHLIVCHKCDNPGCVKPEHLFLGTYKDNALDRENKKRSQGPKKTKCRLGHAYDQLNTYYRPNGGRDCLKCKKIANRKFQEKEKQMSASR